MIVLKRVLLGACIVASISIPAFADEIECSTDCPAEMRKVSFADGNNARCACVDNSAMDETVEDPNVDTNAAYD